MSHFQHAAAIVTIGDLFLLNCFRGNRAARNSLGLHAGWLSHVQLGVFPSHSETRPAHPSTINISINHL